MHPQGRSVFIGYAIGGAVFLAGTVTVRAVEPTRASDFIPSDAVLAGVLTDADEQFADLITFTKTHAVGESPIGDALRANAGAMQAWIGLAGLAAVAGTEPWTALSTMVGSDACVGLWLDENGAPAWMLASVPRDRALRDRIIDTAMTAAGQLVAGEPSPDHCVVIDGTPIFHLGDMHHCRLDGTLLMSNRRGAIEDAVRSKTDALTDEPWFVGAQARAPRNAVAWVCANGDFITRTLPLSEMVPELADQPMIGYLAGAWQYSIRHASDGMAWLERRDGDLLLTIDVDASDEMPATHRRGFLADNPTTTAWPAQRLAGLIGEIVIRRGWADLIADRESLLTLPAAAQVVNFSTGASALFGQLDFVEDIVGRIDGPVRLIATERSFEQAGYTPTPTLPSFALVSTLTDADADGFRRRIHSAAQVGVSIISLDQANKGEAALLLEIDQHAGTRLIRGAYPPPEPGRTDPDADARQTAVDIRYNFEPSVALVGSELVIATSRELAEDIIDAIGGGAIADGLARSTDQLRIHMPALVRTLRANRDALIAGRMIEEGRTRAEGEREIEGLFTALALIDDVSVQTWHEPDSCRARIRLSASDARP